ncbi:MAG: Omp28-related outer membrane protein [Saprospiraceae bacterium]|nr:Omp28-related outer membrane protein [Saprospiraceae bacterium]
MMNRAISIVLALVVLGLTACNENMVMVPPFEAPESDRVILMEEFTGASCPNCPAGAEQTENMLTLYPDNLVAVAIHSDFLGFPAKPGELDLRTEAANDIEAFLGQWRSKPEAAFNRKVFSDRGEDHIRVRTQPDGWINFVQEELTTFARVYVDIETDYNRLDRTVDIVVTATAREGLSGDFRVHVMITESGIITKQKDGSSIIDKFKQKHVLRALLTDVAGENIFSSLGPGLERQYRTSFTIPDEEDMGWWIPENMTVVAFISDGQTKEVLQAGETHIID